MRLGNGPGWVVGPFVGGSRGGLRLRLSLRLPRGKHCVGTGFQTAEAAALLLVSDQKKRWVSREGPREYPASDA